MTENSPFYERKTLSQMSKDEWESLCDGCGKCCVVLLQDEDSDDVHRTRLGCKLLDLKTIRCSDYARRHDKVPGCVRLTAYNIGDLGWMPDTCAYRLIHEGKPLPDWHPLKTGDPDSTHKTGNSVMGQLILETDIDEDDLEEYIVDAP